MARIKRGKTKVARHRKVLKLVKGFRAARRRNYRVADEALLFFECFTEPFDRVAKDVRQRPQFANLQN